MDKKAKQDIVLADCELEELGEFIAGLNESLGIDIKIYTRIANAGHTRIYNIYRYLVYAFFPIKFFLCRKRYRYIICWQQFYALFFCQMCRLFRVKNENYIVACNYTYKPKRLFSRRYFKFFKKNSSCKFMYKIHVLSFNYAKKCADELEVDENKFAVVPFGLPDTYEQWRKTEVEEKDYCFAIGRSNRDFDFLVKAWKYVSDHQKLIIASDTYKPKVDLPDNVIHRTDIVGDGQFPYIANCKVMIIPIDDGAICSGDTVLLKAMSYRKPVIVTEPSTLGEMYIENGVNGLLVKKDLKEFASAVEELLSNPEKMRNLGINARKQFEKGYSRYHMGVKLGEKIKSSKK